MAQLFKSEIFGPPPTRTQLTDLRGELDVASSGGIVGQIVDMCDDLFVNTPSRRYAFRKKMGWRPADSDHVERLDFIIASGGLCNSAYLRKEVQRGVDARLHNARFENDGITETTRKTHYIPVSEPQMSVCRGLLLAHQTRGAVASKRWTLFSKLFKRDGK